MSKLKRIVRHIAWTYFKHNMEITVNHVHLNVNQILENKTALITGGGSGIGEACAKIFADAGCSVIVAGRNVEKLENVRDGIGKDRCRILSMDMMKIGEFDNYVRSALELSLDKKIDILVNSAGVYNSKTCDDDFLKVSETDWDGVMDTNLKGMYFLCQALANYFISNNIKGHIVNIGSVLALKPASTPYGISKWGVAGMTEGIAKNLARYGIIVNGINPGGVATGMNRGYSEENSLKDFGHLNNRIALPEEIGNIALFLASDLCNNMVGSMIKSDGGENFM